MPVILIVLMLIEIFAGIFLFKVGKELFAFKSVKQELEAFKQGKNHSPGKAWLLLWRFKFGRWYTRVYIKTLGDKWATIFYKFAGVVFLVGSIVFFAGALIQIRLLSTMI